MTAARLISLVPQAPRTPVQANPPLACTGLWVRARANKPAGVEVGREHSL